MSERLGAAWPSFVEMIRISDLLESRRYDELVNWMTKVVDTNPTCWQAWNWRAQALEELGDKESARRDYARVVELTSERLDREPLNREQLSARATAHEAIDDLRAARADYQRLLEQATAQVRENPTSWHAWQDRAISHRDIGEDQSAEEDFSRAIALKPDVYGPLVSRAETRLALGRFAEALKDASRAKALNWGEAYAGFDLLRAECYLGLGNAAAARACLTDLPGPLGPDHEECRQRQLAACEELEREAARRLASMGGSEPELTSTPRRRHEPI